MIKIAGLVVLYHPTDAVIDNILTYIDTLSVLYAVDNSEQKDTSIVTKLQNYSKLVYIDNNGNKGIAYALNVGAKRAIEEGYEWLLTMDQDSSFIDDSLTYMISYVENNDTNRIGIISPIYY